MLDIETMGTSSNASMIQLGAAYFDPVTKEVGDTFLASLDLKVVEKLGFVTDAETKAWWAKQNQEVLTNILNEGKNPEEVLTDFSKFTANAKYVWCHTTFDFVIVQNYLKYFKLKNLPYRGAMDIRTLVYLAKLNLNKYDWSNKTHNALQDCLFQIEYCSDAINLVRKSHE